MEQVLQVAFGFLMLWASVLHAEIHIVIDSDVDSGRPIGVVPFQQAGPGVVPENVGGIVAADLRNSGKFNPLDRARLPQQPSNAQEVQPAAWSALGINAVVVGQVTPNPDGSHNVAYRLVDTGGTPGTVLAQNSYKVNKQWLHYAGRTASDKVFEKPVGIKGAFHTRIAYVVQTNGSQLPYELHISDYDSYNQLVVHCSPQPLMSPAWSPDGSKLAHVTFEGDRSALIIQMLANGAVRQVASFPRHNGAPAFSPDGSRLALALSKTDSLDLYVMDLASGQIRQVTDGRSNNAEPIWFPDNQDLAFTSDQAGRPQVYKMNINDDAPQRITWEGLQNQDADVSSGGKFMVMVSSNGGQQHIAKQDLATGGVQVLSPTLLNKTPSLAPNDTMVIYSSSQGMGPILSLVSTDGRFRTRLPAADEQVKFPAWSPYL